MTPPVDLYNYFHMTILRIEHRIQNFDGWKKAFDGDPIDRKKSGVKRYRVCRPADDPESRYCRP